MNERQKYLFPAPPHTEIAKAARQAIRAVKADFPDVTDIQLAAHIEAESAATIARLERMETRKVPASLFTAIGKIYGKQYITAYLDLMDIEGPCEEAVDALPPLTALAAKVAEAMASGRKTIDHRALAGMLGELRAVEAAVTALRSRAMNLGLPA